MGAEGLQNGMVRVPHPQAEAEQSTRYTPEPGEHSGGCEQAVGRLVLELNRDA